MCDSGPSLSFRLSSCKNQKNLKYFPEIRGFYSQFCEPVERLSDLMLSSEGSAPTLPLSLPLCSLRRVRITCITVQTSAGGLGRLFIWSIVFLSILSSQCST